MEQQESTRSVGVLSENGKVNSPVLHSDSQCFQCVHSVMTGKFASDNKGIVAVIPAYNEERFIGSVVLLARDYFETVIVIDDGSRDCTAQVAKSAGATVVELAKNCGKGSALRQGLDRALLQKDLRAIVLLDGDGQHNTRDVPAVVQPVLDARADLVIGSRFLAVRSEIPLWRQAGQHSLTWITNLASGTVLTDSQSGFRALSPAMAWLLLQAHSNGFSVESEMQFAIRQNNLKTVEVPISCIYEEPPKRNPIAHGLQVLDGILRLVAQMRPLLFFGILALFLLLFSLVIAIVAVQIYDQIQTLSMDSIVVALLSAAGGRS